LELVLVSGLSFHFLYQTLCCWISNVERCLVWTTLNRREVHETLSKMHLMSLFHPFALHWSLRLSTFMSSKLVL
jgi:hypothetical protein